MDETTTLFIATALVCIDLIIGGVNGLKTKRLEADKLFVNIMFAPFGPLGFIFRKIFKQKAEEGKAAISASYASIGVGSIVLFLMILMTLLHYELLSQKFIEVVIPITMSLFILGMIIMIIIIATKKRIK